MLRKLHFGLVLSLLTITSLAAQTGCPGCIINLPELPADTIFLADAPNGTAGVFYDQDLSFRLPLTTTPVNATDPTVPAGLDISQFTVLAVAGLPAGMTWEANQLVFDPEETTDGCVKLCGTPLLPGLYNVEVVIEAVVLIFPQQTSFSFPLLIEPAQTISDGFTLVNESGCGEVTTSFINNIPSNGAEGFTYFWFFGNGNATTVENPADQTYNQPGEYTVEYEAIVDTTGYFLTQVTIEQSPCSDLLSAQDLKFDLLDPTGELIFVSPIVQDATPPITFDVLLPLEEGEYTINVVDDDGGILDGDDDLCGSITINQESQGEFVDGELIVNITTIHPVDTIRSTATVTVFEQPLPPILSIVETPPYCEDVPITLQALPYDSSLVWFNDSLLVVDETLGTLSTTDDGEYFAIYTSPDGCTVSSLPLSVSYIDNPADFDLVQEGNLLSMEDQSNLPANFSFTWMYEGTLIPDATDLLLCTQAVGTYTLTITDETTGCSTQAEIEGTYDPAINCSTSTDDVLAETPWTVFPNPVAESLWVRGPIVDDLLLLLYDPLGRPVAQLSLNENEQQVSLSHLPSGSYIYRITTAGGPTLQGGILVKQ